MKVCFCLFLLSYTLFIINKILTYITILKRKQHFIMHLKIQLMIDLINLLIYLIEIS